MDTLFLMKFCIILIVGDEVEGLHNYEIEPSKKTEIKFSCPSCYQTHQSITEPTQRGHRTAALLIETPVNPTCKYL